MKKKLPKLRIHKHCHSALIRALQNFEGKVTPSHSATAQSHKHSIYNLFQKEVESAITDVLGAEFVHAIAQDGFSNVAQKDARLLEDRIRTVSSFYEELSWQNEEAKLRHGTLETLLSVIRYCRSFSPGTFTDRHGNEPKGEPVRRLIHREKTEHFPFCELCERLCEWEDLKAQGIKPEYKERSAPSSRFCKVHKTDGSDYQRDYYWRKAFHKKIEELEEALAKNTHVDGIEKLKKCIDEEYYEESLDEATDIENKLKSFPVPYIDVLIRRTAYELVYSNKQKSRRKISSSIEESTLNRAKELMAEGCNISEAAKIIGISRQAISKALKKDQSKDTK